MKTRSKRFLLPVTLAIALLTGTTETYAYQVFGAGASSCGTWTSDRNNPAMHNFEEAWVLGFLSGVGYMGGVNNMDPLNGLDSAAVAAWVDNYCLSNPLQDIVEAAQAFVAAHPR